MKILWLFAGLILYGLLVVMTTVGLAAGGTWMTKADMPTARYFLSASVVDGKTYVIEGSSGFDIYATVEVYDAATGQLGPTCHRQDGLCPPVLWMESSMLSVDLQTCQQRFQRSKPTIRRRTRG